MGALKKIGKALTFSPAVELWKSHRKTRAKNKRRQARKEKVEKKAVKQAMKREKEAFGAYKSGIKGMKGVAEGKGALPHSLSDTIKRFGRASSSLDRMYDAQKAANLAEFKQNYLPQQIEGGRAMGDRSSALNQAIAAATTDYKMQQDAMFENMRNQMATNILNQSNQAKLANLNAQMQSYGGMAGQQMSPLMSNLAMNSAYLNPQQKPSVLASALPVAGGLIGGIAGGGNPAAIQAGIAGGTAAGQMI